MADVSPTGLNGSRLTGDLISNPDFVTVIRKCSGSFRRAVISARLARKIEEPDYCMVSAWDKRVTTVTAVPVLLVTVCPNRLAVLQRAVSTRFPDAGSDRYRARAERLRGPARRASAPSRSQRKAAAGRRLARSAGSMWRSQHAPFSPMRVRDLADLAAAGLTDLRP
jgi:hypothetical protein